MKEYKAADFERMILEAQSANNDVQTEYKDAREYYENVQTPTGVPKGKEYVQENLITDLINGLVGQLIGGKISINIGGGGKMAAPIRELVGDIMDRNMFSEQLLEPIGNFFYCEGMAGIYIMYDPYKVGPYGIGMPVIYVLKPNGELLLDPASVGSMHEDDNYRAFYKQASVSYIEKKYPKVKGKVKAINIPKSTEQYGQLYTIEFKEPDIIAVKNLPKPYRDKLLKSYEENTKVEFDKFYQTVIVNTDTIAEDVKATGYSRFRIIPVIHTARFQSKRLPMGAAVLMKGKQDQINVVGSVALDAVKADIKNLILVTGTPSTEIEAKIRSEAAKTNGVVVIPGAEARINQVQRQGISPAILQWYEWQRKSFDEVSGRYAPERGATDIGLSGRAIGLLQARGTIPELTKRLHLEYAFTEMAYVILECVANKMSRMRFSITRKIDNDKKTLHFNQDKNKVEYSDDEYSVLADNTVNDLTKVDVDDIDISVQVNMDAVGKETDDMNKAVVAYQNKLLSRVDAIKKLYKDEWRDVIENLEKEDAVFKIMQQLMRLGPEKLAEVANTAGGLEKMINTTDQVEKGERFVGIPETPKDIARRTGEATNPAAETMAPVTQGIMSG